VAKGRDYSDIKDFREKKELCRRIVEHDLEFVNKADVLVVVATRPSFGTAIEMLIARNSGKRVILLAKEPVPTPWPIHFSDDIVKNEDELIALLHRYRDHHEKQISM
jgi:nucleoside 2-deoxyribosyltransferase